MADLAITAANVAASSTAQCAYGTAGATITAGQPIYIDTANSNVLKLAQCDGTALEATVAGIALHGASAGQPVKYVYEDSAFTSGGTMTVGQIYAVSATAGGVAPVSDLVSTNYPSVLFVAKSATQAVMKIVRGGVQKA